MPSFVVHVTPSRLASTPAVTVAPLFPPQPTSITPSLGTLVLVLNSYVVDVGRTCAEGKRGVRLRAASRQCALRRAREQNTPHTTSGGFKLLLQPGAAPRRRRAA